MTGRSRTSLIRRPMGNSQTAGIEKSRENTTGDGGDGLTSPSSTTFGGSIRSRRGSKAKVFGLLGQKKSPKEPTTPTTPTATVTAGLPQNVASTTSSAIRAIGRISSIDEETEAELHQKHDAVVRQLEFQQMEIRAKQTAQKSTKSKLFSRKKYNISSDNVKSYRTEKVPIHKKRPALKPASATNEQMVTSQTTTDKFNESGVFNLTDITAQNGNETKNTHRAFIENLIDSTLQLQTPNSGDIVQAPVFCISHEKTMPITTPYDQIKKKQNKKNDNDRRATKTKGVQFRKQTQQEYVKTVNVSVPTLPILTGKTSDNNHTILSDTMVSDNDRDDDFQNSQMATSLTLMMTMSNGGGVEVGKGGGRSHYSLRNENCDIVVLRDLSSSSDSLFTDPLTPPQSVTSTTAHVDCSTAEPCSTIFDDIDDIDDDLCDVDDDENNEETNLYEYKHKSKQTHIEKAICTPASATQLPISLKELTANTTLISRATAAAVTGKEQHHQQNQQQQRRPLSDISITSGDTSGILSPTTAKAIVELQKRHQADKLSLLSVAKTTYLELLPTEITAPQTESSPELETESPDEQMALHLGKKLAQVLSGSSSSAGGNNSGNTATGNANSGVMASSSAAGSSVPDNITCCNMVTGTNELFNIAKAKKIELPSLSSRLVATSTQISPATATTEVPDAHTGNIIASTDAKHLPTLQSQLLTLPTSTSAACPTAAVPATATTTTSTETQSTVIISFKSSQTPVQSQPSLSITGIEHLHTPAIATPFYNEDKIIETMSYTPTTPTFVSNNNSNITYSSMTAQMGSPLCTPRTTKNNVLKKVASFTLEKAAGGSANKNNGDPNSGIAGQLENVGSKRSTFVPEKLSFAAYEKFEGQMLMKWFISSLQNNCNHLSEQDIGMLTLQYCNNLINVGVLKQISEKNDLETFKPFQMYQWTHTEAPTTSQPLTPGKLDKVTSWPYCSTPSSGASRIPKAIQGDTPHTERDNGFLQILRKKLLSCSTIAEVHTVINDMLSAGEPLRRPSRRCVLLSDLLNASEATVYQYDKNVTGASFGCESGVHEAGVQTEVSQAIVRFVCSRCKDMNTECVQYEAKKYDKEVQVSWSKERDETLLDEKKLTLVKSEPIARLHFLPPPLAGSIVASPPPPPPPPTVLPPPPPPPPPSSVGPPPPPPPSSSSAATVLSLNTSTVPPPPPPGTIKTPSTTTPAPLPNPAEGGWFNQANMLRKTAVNPPKPMKPLYWTRIVTQPLPPKVVKPIAEMSATGDVTDSSSPGTSPDEPVSSESPSVSKEIWQEIDETCLDNIDEFTELFSREAVVPKVVPKVKKEVRVRPIKVLDSKRSQNVGILLRSSHVDFCEIEHAIYHVDTSVVSLETLQQINKNKATNEELERIKEQGDTPLDEPEQFLLKISQISMFTERISCMVFMAEFEETATLIERKLEVVMQLSQFLMESEELKLTFAIILTLGNYMNGGNRQRGQADGFTLEILSKLKDVKSKDSQTTLLHFIVRTYISRKRKEGVQLLEIPLPIPEPSDVERATQVDFDEVKDQITKLNDQLNAKKRTTDKVITHSTSENLEPFKSKMKEFIENASKDVNKLYKELEDCREVFIDTMKFYHYVPKSGTLEQCTPNKFFEHWTNFTNDFKDIMKKEIAVLWNELLKKTKDVQTRKTIKTTKVKPGGLKERIMRLNKK